MGRKEGQKEGNEEVKRKKKTMLADMCNTVIIDKRLLKPLNMPEVMKPDLTAFVPELVSMFVCLSFVLLR